MFSIYSIMSFANTESFISSLPIWMLFISFCCLIAMTSPSTFTMLNKCGESGHSSVSFPINDDVSCGLTHLFLIVLKARQSKVMVHAGLVFGEVLLSGS